MCCYDVFISYSSKDESKAIEIRDYLVEKNLKCWMAPDSIPVGSNYQSEIPKGIENANILVLVLSENSQKSIWVPKEVSYALDQGKCILPFEISKGDLLPAFKFLLINIQIDDDIKNLSDRIFELKRSFSNDIINLDRVFKGSFGPERKTFTWENRAPYAVFNSITDNPYYGDERYFVKIREYVEGQETPFKNSLKIKKGREYEVSIYYHNNSDSNIGKKAIGIADGVGIRSSFPATIKEKGYITANIIASDTKPIEIWACAEITTDEPCYLRYIPGTATYNCGGLLNGNSPGPDWLFGVGSLIGYNKISGLLPGGEQYAGSIKYRIFADYPDFKVRISNWKNIIEADSCVYSVMIRYENIGTMDQLNVVAKAILEPQTEFIFGSCYLTNNNFNKKSVNDDIVKEQGMNIGDYAGGAGWAELEFKVTKPKKPDEGIKIKAIVSTTDGNKSVETVLK